MNEFYPNKPYLSGQYSIPPTQMSIRPEVPSELAMDDKNVFQFSIDDYPKYVKNYDELCGKGLEDYYGTTSDFDRLSKRVTEFCVKTLVQEYPEHFDLIKGEDGFTFVCYPAKKQISLKKNYSIKPDYLNILGELAPLLQEDMAVVRVQPSGTQEIIGTHITAPNYWRPASVLEKNINEIHGPVPDLPRIGQQWLQKLAEKNNRMVQFQWGITTDDRLNHLPDPPNWYTGTDAEWTGRTFNVADPKLFVRVERQTFIGLGSGFLFLIRTYFHDCKAMTQTERNTLAEAIDGMDEATRLYKGLEDSQNEAICKWLTRCGN